MWELYDSLVNEIPTERKVAAAFVGNCWTVVTADDGTMGVAMTTRLETVPQQRAAYTGAPLGEIAGCIRSWNLVEAAIGMAAVNAWYNSRANMERLRAAQGTSATARSISPSRGSASSRSAISATGTKSLRRRRPS